MIRAACLVVLLCSSCSSGTYLVLTVESGRTITVTSLHLVTSAATYPLPMVPARLGGFPAWLRGPLSGPAVRR